MYLTFHTNSLHATRNAVDTGFCITPPRFVFNIDKSQHCVKTKKRMAPQDDPSLGKYELKKKQRQCCKRTRQVSLFPHRNWLATNNKNKHGHGAATSLYRSGLWKRLSFFLLALPRVGILFIPAKVSVTWFVFVYLQVYSGVYRIC